MAELEPGPEPGAPALDLVSCSPGQQLEGRRERKGGEVTGEDSTKTLGESLNEETESERRWRRRRKKRMVIARKRRKKGEGGDGGGGGGLERGQWKSH